jgi:two-component system chemotaxis response regulator CheB
MSSPLFTGRNKKIMHRKIKVLIVDDSAVVREILETILSRDKDIEVVGKASDVYSARDKIVLLKPDVLTLDVEMPKMDGLEFLRRLMPQNPLPVVMVSSMTASGSKITLDALEAGAVDFVLKPAINTKDALKLMAKELTEKVKVAAGVDVSKYKHLIRVPFGNKQKMTNRILEGSTDKVLAIGASTGGTIALTKIISQMPADIPGTVIVQHMPAVFTRLFAESLNKIAKVEVKEAEHQDRIVTGRVLIAPGEYQMEVVRSGGQYLVNCIPGEKVNGHCPSVDVLFNSVAMNVGINALGVILTGMGKDGAAGMLEMRKKGARTMAQDEASSIVFGMPGEAFKIGAAEKLVSLEQINANILLMLKEIKGKS